ncbi:MAG TPA: amino acid permease [Methylomirabilota bacterium]|nr:amino acid permease [Methylomirabilota bacterium]
MTARRPAPETGPATAPTLRRTLRLWQVSVSGIGVILGAGVYALIGPAAGLAGDALWLAFLLAGVAAGLTAYAYARLGAMRPKDSPEFQYTALAFGPRMGFLAGWLMLAADLLAVAVVALGFGGYLAHLAGTPGVANALVLLVAAVVVLLVGIGESVGLAILLTLVETAGLLFVIAIGLPNWSRVSLLEAPHGFAGLSSAAALIFFAYLGFDEIGNFAEEMHQPQRNLPRALFLSLVGATLIYVLVALSVTAAVDWRDLSASTAPLALVARQVLGPTADTAISVIALAATSNTVLLLLIAAARSVYGMAAAGALPGRLGAVGARGTPVRATLLVTGITASLVLLDDLAQVAALTDAAVLLSFMLVNLSLFWVARRGATGPGLARRALDFGLPVLALLMCAWLLVHTGWLSLAATAGLAVLGLALGRRLPKRGADASPLAPGATGTRID